MGQTMMIIARAMIASLHLLHNFNDIEKVNFTQLSNKPVKLKRLH